MSSPPPPGHGPEPPEPLTRERVIGIEEAANAILAAGNAHNDFVLQRERCDGHRIAELIVGDLDVPTHTAGPGVERHQVRIDGTEKDLVIEQRHPTVYLSTAGHNALRERPSVAPNGSSGPKVERRRVRRRFGDVHDPIHHQRRHLELLQRAGLIDPRRLKLTDVVTVDLVQRGVALRPVRARIRQPMLRLRRGIQDSFVRHLTGRATRHRDQHRHKHREHGGEAKGWR